MMRIKRILVTGCCGFIGSNFVRFVLESDPAIEITNLDALTYAGNPDNLAEIADEPALPLRARRYRRPADGDELVADGKFDAIVNFAAESHVDRSINDATPFLRTNVIGTQCLLDAARAAGVPRFVQVSTDEVYGTLSPDDPEFCETTPLAPNSPYAASKAGADLLVRAAHHTFGMDTVITRCSNNYGPFQFPEKLIPLVHHQCAGRDPGAGLRRWPPGSRLDSRPGPLPRHRRSPAPRPRGRGLQLRWP